MFLGRAWGVRRRAERYEARHPKKKSRDGACFGAPALRFSRVSIAASERARAPDAPERARRSESSDEFVSGESDSSERAERLSDVSSSEEPAEEYDRSEDERPDPGLAEAAAVLAAAGAAMFLACYEAAAGRNATSGLCFAVSWAASCVAAFIAGNNLRHEKNS